MTFIDFAYNLYRVVYHRALSVEELSYRSFGADVLVSVFLLVVVSAGEGYGIGAYSGRAIVCLCQQPPVYVGCVGDIRLSAGGL